MPHHEGPENLYVSQLRTELKNLIGQEIKLVFKNSLSLNTPFIGVLLKVEDSIIQMSILDKDAPSETTQLTALISDIAYFTNIAPVESNTEEVPNNTENEEAKGNKEEGKGNKEEGKGNKEEDKGHKGPGGKGSK